MVSRNYYPKPSRLVQWLYSRQRRHVLLLIVTAYLLQNCQPNAAQEEAYASSGNPVKTYPEAVQVNHAQGFDITYHENYKVLHQLSGQDTVRYLLLPEGISAPKQVKADQVIHLPVQKVITQSTTHIGLIEFAGAEDIIIGIDEVDYIYSDKIRKKVIEGKIQEVGGGESLNTEMVLALEPDLLMVSGMPGIAMERYQTIINAGIPVLINTEWMENSLLAKAEWVKLIAALTEQEELVERKFSAIENQYDSIAALTSKIKNKPEVIVGSPFQDAWYIPGGKSYRSHLLQQAGAEWPWSNDTSAVSILVDFEIMYAYGLKANYWLNPGQVSTKQELLAKDTRFADFKSFRENQVYNNNKRLNPQGSGNDYYESGVVHPHLILSDVIKILHPELLPDYTLYYYQKIK